jgi:hypothetical protein
MDFNEKVLCHSLLATMIRRSDESAMNLSGARAFLGVFSESGANFGEFPFHALR